MRIHLQASAQIEQPEQRIGRGGYTYTVGTNERQRPDGELPPPGGIEVLADLVSSGERKNQRRIASYLERLSSALGDQWDLEGWDTNQDAANACRLVLGEQRASDLAAEMGPTARNVLEVAIDLGYRDERDE